LESDWVAVGLIDLAVAGVVDFREARLTDPVWNRRVFTLLKGLRREQRFKTADARFRFYLTQYAHTRPDDARGTEKAHKQAVEAYYDVIGAVVPWEGRTYAERAARTMRSDRQAYIDVCGVDPADPAFKKWEAEQIAAALADNKKRDAEVTADDMAVRRIREAADKKKGR
jgi:hypothetical protein